MLPARPDAWEFEVLTSAILATLVLSNRSPARGARQRIDPFRRSVVTVGGKGTGAQGQRIGPKAPKVRVSVVGNFAGEFTSVGPGEGTSLEQTVYIDVDSKSGIGFTATGFGPITISGVGTAGNVTYEMTLMSGTPSNPGSVLSGPVSGTDAGFNGKQVVELDPPSNGKMVLRLRRTLYLNGKAGGALTLSTAGSIVLTLYP